MADKGTMGNDNSGLLCPYCHKKYQVQWRFDNHVEKHESGEIGKDGKKPKPIPTPTVCPICDKTFSSLRGMSMHKRFHDDGFRERHRKSTIDAQPEITDEARKVISEKTKERWSDPEYRERTAKSIRESVTTDEHRAKQSVISKERWESQEYREKYTQNNRDLWDSDEFKTKMSEISTLRWSRDRESHMKNMRKGYSETAHRFADSKDFASEYILGFGAKPKFHVVADKLGIPYSSVVRIVSEHGLQDLIDRYSGTSHMEDTLSLYVERHVDVVRGSRSIIRPYEIDIFVPSRNLAIEFNGIYWHSILEKGYHLNKSEMCESQGIRLIHVFEWEWIDSREKIESILDSALGNTTRVYARECEFVRLTPTESRVFMEDNHIQGNVGAKHHFGLKRNGVLLSAMTFGDVRFSGDFDYEMLRFCSKLGHTVVGGESKLFSNAIKTLRPRSVISYCDRSKFTGIGYEKLGFVHTRNTEPSYRWVNGYESLSRYRTQMKNETEIMENRGYRKIYDCGNKVYEWTQNPF